MLSKLFRMQILGLNSAKWNNCVVIQTEKWKLQKKGTVKGKLYYPYNGKFSKVVYYYYFNKKTYSKARKFSIPLKTISTLAICFIDYSRSLC